MNHKWQTLIQRSFLLIFLLVPVSGDYSASVSVYQDDYDLKQASSEALEKLFIRLTGNPFVVTTPGVYQAFQHAHQWINSYEQTVDGDTVLLHVSFDQISVDRFFKSRHLRIWMEENRPETLVLTLDGEWETDIVQLAQQRGLVVKTKRDVAAATEQELVQIMKESNASYLLRQVSEKRWSLLNLDGDWEAVFEVDDYLGLIDQLMVYYVEYSSVLFGLDQKVVKVVLKGVSHYQDLKAVIDQIKHNKLVNRVVVDNILNHDCVLTVELSAGLNDLRSWWSSVDGWQSCDSDLGLCFVRDVN
ncbi:MAG: hypothetical protein CMF46_02450 [Legionellales bacterium]|nr:hypothetical protein [Legionellales bacterium]|tara:strand:+ start:957 stop:1862 length:906 start_codon:yes stop_codon:yes gene_type:complete